jgi:hypothetical protein
VEEPLQQHRLKRELGLSDLAFMQVLLIVGLPWAGTIGVEGSTHVFLWLAERVVAFGRFPVPLRLAAVCGFLVSAAALPFQIVPIIGVTDRLGFALKVGG